MPEDINPLATPDTPQPDQIVNPAPSGFFSTALDYLQRPLFASAKFFDSFSQDGVDALSKAASEFWDPKQRLTFSDVIRNHFPDFAKEHPIATGMLGLVGDVALDPTTWLGIGEAGDAAKAIGFIGDTKKAFTLTKEGGAKLAELTAEELGKIVKPAVSLPDNVVRVFRGESGVTKNLPDWIEQGLKDSGAKDAAGRWWTADPKIAEWYAKESKGQVVFQDIPKDVYESSLVSKQPPNVARFSLDPTNEVFLPKDYKGLGQPGSVGLTTPFNETAKIVTSPEMASRNAQQKMVDLISGGYLQPAGATQYLDKGGIKFAGLQTPITGDVLSKLADITGLSRVGKIIENTKAFETAARLFNRNWRLPEEYIDGRDVIVHTTEAVNEELRKVVVNAGKVHTPEEINQIGKIGMQIDDATQSAKAGIEASGGVFTDKQAAEIAQEIMDSSNFTPQMKATYAQLQMGLRRQKQLEMQAGILNHDIQNYFPRVYTSTKDSTQYLAQKRQGLLSVFFGPDKAREFANIEDAKAAGLVPDENALTAYALRIMTGRQKIANKELNDLATRFAANSVGLDSTKTLERLYQDIKFIGDSQWPAGLESGMRDLGLFYDKALNTWKGLATTIKPSFGFRQLVSNTLQSFLVAGTKAFKVFDPRVMRDVGGMLLYDKGVLQAGTPAAERLLAGTQTNINGITKTTGELLDLFKRIGVFRGTNITGESLRQSIEQEVSHARTINKWFGPEHQGLGNFMSGLSRYFNWASHVEDYSRGSLALNAWRMGHSEADIAKMVNRALFDYSGGLSQFERQVMKRIVPFYSFNRFAVPLIAKTLVTNPGRVTGIDKIAKDFFSTWNKYAGGDTLSPSERAVLPGYLTEQSNVYEGFDKQLGKAIFRTFNNFSPLDISGSIEYDPTGNVDFGQTMMKAGLAQLTPILKMPLELAMDKNFFSGQAISREGNPTAGKVGNVTPEQFLGNLATIVMGKTVGLPAALLTKGATGILNTPDAVQNGVKKALGWEDAVDPRTGKRQVYINPYLAYGLSSAMPALNVLIRASDPERHPYEKVLDTFFGVGTSKVDLQQSRRILFNKQTQSIDALKTQIRRAMIYGRYDEVDKLRQDMADLMQQINSERASINANDIRGGIPPQ